MVAAGVTAVAAGMVAGTAVVGMAAPFSASGPGGDGVIPMAMATAMVIRTTATATRIRLIRTRIRTPNLPTLTPILTHTPPHLPRQHKHKMCGTTVGRRGRTTPT